MSESYTEHEAEVEAEALRLEKQDDEGYSDAEARIDDVQAERGSFVRDVGISISTKREGRNADVRADIEEQLQMVEREELKQVQIDFRNRPKEDFPVIAELLRSISEQYSDVRISLHITNPSVEGCHIKNRDQLREQLMLANELGGGTSTIHPPTLKQEEFYGLSQNDQDTLIHEFAQLLAEPAMDAHRKHLDASVAIENMPDRGDQGKWTQKPEEVRMLVDAVTRELLGQHGLTMEEAKRYAGATLDIGHALEGKDVQDPAVIEHWLETLGDRLKAIHVYTPSLGESGRRKKEFQEWFAEIAALYRKHHSQAIIFLESKQDPDTTLAMHTFAQAAALAPRAEQGKQQK